jgi:hypothetical protein
MQRQSLTLTATTAQRVVPIDTNKCPVNIGVAAIVTGTASYTLQHTFDDVFATGFTATGATWFNSTATNMVAATSNQSGSYLYPVTALTLTVGSGAGSVNFVVVQAGVQ